MAAAPRAYCFVATGYLVRDGKTLLLKHKKLGAIGKAYLAGS